MTKYEVLTNTNVSETHILRTNKGWPMSTWTTSDSTWRYIQIRMFNFTMGL